ncbi:hypothetical protein AB0M95_07280 [Sphaerisporangium sp. NPDC051017]
MSVRELATTWGAYFFTGEPAIAERHGEPRTILVHHARRIERHNHLDSAG